MKGIHTLHNFDYLYMQIVIEPVYLVYSDSIINNV
jgi:hypothetical protein